MYKCTNLPQEIAVDFYKLLSNNTDTS